MAEERNNYLVYVPGKPMLTISYISRARAMRQAEEYRALGHDVRIDTTEPTAFGVGFYEDWDYE